MGFRITRPLLAEQWQRNTFACTLGVFLGISGFTFTLPFLPLYLREVAGLDAGGAAFWAGMAQGLAGAGTFVAGPIWGVLGDRLGRKPLLVRAQIGAALATMAFIPATSVAQVLMARIAVGVFGGSTVAAMSLIAATTPKEKVPRAMGILQAGQLTGMAMGPVLGGTLVELVGFRLTFFITSMIMVCGGLIVLAVTKEGPRVRPAPRTKGARGSGELGKMLRSQAVVVVLFASLLFAFSRPMTQPVLPPFTQSLLREGDPVNLVVGGLFFGIGLAGALGAMGTSRLISKVGLHNALIISAVGSGLFLLPQGAARNVAQLIVLALAMAFFLGALQTTSVALLSSITPRTAISSSFGVFQSVQSAGGALGPIFGGAVAVNKGTPWVFPIAGAIFLASGLLLLAAARGGLLSRAPDESSRPGAEAGKAT